MTSQNKQIAMGMADELAMTVEGALDNAYSAGKNEIQAPFDIVTEKLRMARALLFAANVLPQEEQQRYVTALMSKDGEAVKESVVVFAHTQIGGK